MVDRISFYCGACCGVVRILSYALCRSCRKRPPQRPEYNIICLGLSMTGKTTLLSALCGEEVGTNIERTTGFNMKDIILSTCTMHVKEIGGAPQVRHYWQHYLGEGHHGIIFVINSAVTDEELSNTIRELRKLLTNPKNSGVPCLVLATYQDHPSARKDDIAGSFLLDELCAGRPWAVHPCVSIDVDSVRIGFEKLATLIWQNDHHDEVLKTEL